MVVDIASMVVVLQAVLKTLFKDEQINPFSLRSTWALV